MKWYQKPLGIIALLFLFFPIGLYLMWKYSGWSNQAKWTITGAFAVAVFLMLIIPQSPAAEQETVSKVEPKKVATISAKQKAANEAEAKKKAEEAAVDYKIVEDGDSSYADVTRKDLRIVLASGVTEAQLKNTLTKVVEEYTNQNKDVDALIVFAYDREQDIGGIFTLGKATWAPEGDWSKAENTDDRGNYQISFQIMKKVTDPEGEQKPTDEEFAIYDAYQAEMEGTDRSMEDEEKAKAVVASKYKMTPEEVRDVVFKLISWVNY